MRLVTKFIQNTESADPDLSYLNTARFVLSVADGHGADGVGITDVEIRNRHLFLSTSSGAELDAGSVFTESDLPLASDVRPGIAAFDPASFSVLAGKVSLRDDLAFGLNEGELGKYLIDNKYATQSWIRAQGFIGNDGLALYATTKWVLDMQYAKASSLNNYLLKSIWDEAFEIVTVDGVKVISAKLNILGQKGITAYADASVSGGGAASGSLGALVNVGAWADGVPSADRVLVQLAGATHWSAKLLSEIVGLDTTALALYLSTNSYLQAKDLPASYEWSKITGQPTVYPTDWSHVEDKPTVFPSTWDSVFELATISGAQVLKVKLDVWGLKGMTAYSDGTLSGGSASGALVDLVDVSVSRLAAGDILKYDGTHFVNIPLSSVSGSSSWNDITGKPDAFKPSAHVHPWSEITGAPTQWAWSAISGKPTVYPTDWANVAGRPASLPASDVYAWAKAASKPGYTYSEIGGRPTKLSDLTDDVVAGKYLANNIWNEAFEVTTIDGVRVISAKLDFLGQKGITAYADGFTPGGSGGGLDYDLLKQALTGANTPDGYPFVISTTFLGGIDKSYLTGKLAGTYADKVHTHLWANITDRPTALPASDVYPWAKAAAKPGYSWGEITGKPASMPANGGNADTANVANYANAANKVCIGGTSAGAQMQFNWAGRPGQPTWLWGGSDPSNMYVYDPAILSVASAVKATQDGNGNVIANTYLPKSGGSIAGRLAWMSQVIDSLNNLQSGTYNINNSSHAPTSSGWYHVINSSYDYDTVNWLGQIAIPFGGGTGSPNNEMYFRHRIAEAWQPWNRIYHSGNFNPDSKFDKSGGTLTGNLTITNGSATPSLTLYRAGLSSWDVLNSSGNLYFRNNYTSAAGSYFNVLTLAYDTGNATFKGTVTAPSFTGDLSGTATGANGLLYNNDAGGSYFLQAMQLYTQNAAGDLPTTNSWHHVLKFSHGNGDTYYNRTLALPFSSNEVYTRRRENGTAYAWSRLWGEHNANRSDADWSARNITAAGSVTAPSFVGNLSGTASTSNSLTYGGAIAAIGGTTTIASGLSLYGVYNNGYPCTYGNLLRFGGLGSGEMLFGWTGDTSVGDLYYRSKRDTASTPWSGWAKVWNSANSNLSTVDWAARNIVATAKVYANDWFRSYGNTGWYSQDYGGGIYMQDSTWVRVYNGKNFLVQGAFRAEGSGYFGGTLQIESNAAGNFNEGLRIAKAVNNWAGIILGCNKGVTEGIDGGWFISRTPDNTLVITYNTSIVSLGGGIELFPDKTVKIHGNLLVTGGVTALG